MKKLLILLLLVICNFTYSQFMNRHELLSVQNWSDTTIYFRWAHPTIRGYGPLSDSLASAIPGKAEFYQYQNTYYSIASWADYFNWFTKAYWWRFSRPVLEYETFYLLEDNFMMVWWLRSQFQGLKKNGLLDLNDPFSRTLARFEALYDSKEFQTMLAKRERDASDNGRGGEGNSRSIFGAFSSGTSAGASDSGSGMSGASGGTTSEGKSIGN